MQQAEKVGKGIRKQKNVAGETLPAGESGSEGYAELAHDARNMVTALALYCQLLEEPGVLAEGSRHFAQELRLVTAASWRLLEKLTHTEQRGPARLPDARPWRSVSVVDALPGTRPLAWHGFADEFSGAEIQDLAEELAEMRDLLAALAGPGVSLHVTSLGGAWPVALKGEDLTRMMVNLVRNSAEAMGGSGTIRILLAERPVDAVSIPLVRLTVEDSGPGIPQKYLAQVFEKGISAMGLAARAGAGSRRSSGHQGLGLSIVRELVEAAGGRVWAENGSSGGACISIELPVVIR